MALGEEATRAGVLLDTQGLAPSAAGGPGRAGRRAALSVTDGPFAEAKEIISYALYEVRSKEEAVEWASRFLAAAPGPVARVGGRAPRSSGCSARRTSADRPDEPSATPRIEAVWRIESARLVAGLARLVGDVGLAEELAQDALVAALEQWPARGRAGQPGRLADVDREAPRDRPAAPPAERTGASSRRSAGCSTSRQPDEPDLDDHVGDDLLRLVFIACHPVLRTEAPGGADPAAARRADHGRDRPGVPGPGADRGAADLPGQEDPARRRGPRSSCRRRPSWPARLASVLEVVYLIFNEGYAATAGDDWMRPELCAEALRLGRVLAGPAAGPSPRCTGWSR